MRCGEGPRALGGSEGPTWTPNPLPPLCRNKAPISGKEVATAVKGQAHPHPQQCTCSLGTHPGPPEDRALRPKCQTWSGATILQISGTWGRHHRALGRKEALSQMARGRGK